MKRLSPVLRKSSIPHKEDGQLLKGKILYAVAWGMKTMKFYLHGNFFELFTDHKPLVGLFNKEEAPNNRMMTMLLSTMVHRFYIYQE